MSEVILGNFFDNPNISKDRLKALELLKSMGLPSKKSEIYRYFDIKTLLESSFKFDNSYFEEIAEGEDLLIVDGVIKEAPKELDIKIVDAIKIDESHFDPLYFTGHLLVDKIAMVSFKGDMKLTVKHKYTKSKSFIPSRLSFDIAENSRVEILEIFEEEKALNSFVLGGYDISLQKYASLEFIKQESLVKDGYISVFSNSFNLSENAVCSFKTYDFGSGDGLQLFNARLGKNANFNASHLLFVKDGAKRGTVSKIVHLGESSKSNQLSKNIISKGARGIFDALIKVEQSGKYTKAHQNSKAILLDSSSYMVSKPQLEIYIDDLEANHGSTTGQIDENELFYLRSRGIDEKEAKKMLIEAFANEMIDAIKDEQIKEMIHCSFEEAYYGHAQLNCIDTCHGCEDIILKEKR